MKEFRPEYLLEEKLTYTKFGKGMGNIIVQEQTFAHPDYPSTADNLYTFRYECYSKPFNVQSYLNKNMQYKLNDVKNAKYSTYFYELQHKRIDVRVGTDIITQVHIFYGPYLSEGQKVDKTTNFNAIHVNIMDELLTTFITQSLVLIA